MTGASNEVYALNPSTAKEIAYVPDDPTTHGSEPSAFAIDPVHDTLWVANLAGSIVVINLSSDALVRSYPLADGPRAIAYDADTGFVYAVGYTTGLVTVINSTTLQVVESKAVHGASSVAWDPLSNTLYLTVSVNREVLVVNASSLTVDHTIYPLANGFSPTDSIYDPADGTMVVAGGANIAFINATTNRLLSTNGTLAPGGSRADSLAFNPATNEVYAAPAGRLDGSGVAVLDATTNAYLREISTAGSAPSPIAYAPSTHRLFAFGTTANSTDGVAIIDGANDSILNGSLPLAVHYYSGTYDPNSGLVYVATSDPSNDCGGPGSVTLVDPAPRPSIRGSIPVGAGPRQVGIDPSLHRLFVTNFCSNSVSVINDSSNTVVNLSVPVGQGPEGIAVDPGAHVVYIASLFDHAVWAIKESTLAISYVQGYGNGSSPYALAFDPVDHRLFVALYDRSNISIINTSSGLGLGSWIPVGSVPEALEYDPANGVLYIACSGSSNVTLLNASSLRVVGSVSTDKGPDALALDASAGILYVASYAAGTVDLIATSAEARIPGSLPVSSGPDGLAFAPISNQIDVFDQNNGTVSVLANSPQIASLRADRNSTEPEVPITLVASVVNGTAPFDFGGSTLPPGCVPADSPVVTCSFSRPGTFGWGVNLTDAAGYPAWGNLRVSVLPPPTATAFSASPTALDVGQALILNVTTSGGIPPFTYNYLGLPPGCVNQDYPEVSCAPASTGVFLPTVIVNDSVGGRAETSTRVVVSPVPQILAFAATPSTIYPNSSFALSVITTGGASPLGFAFQGLPAGCPTVDAPTLTCRVTEAEFFVVIASVSDSTGAMASDSLALTVLPFPTLEVSLRAVPGTAHLGEAVTVFANVSGAVDPLSESFAGLPPGCGPHPEGSFVCTPTSVGNYTMSLAVRDGGGRELNRTVLLQVVPTKGTNPQEVAGPVLSIGALAGLAFLALGSGLVGVLATTVWLGRGRRPPPQALVRAHQSEEGESCFTPPPVNSDDSPS
ncbi:MAG: YncE family protein [Thermoplasmata archaeon]|nr:YncE family protein [Thermoplasmata archaeon]